MCDMGIKSIIASKKRIGETEKERSFHMKVLALHKWSRISADSRKKHGLMMSKKRWQKMKTD